MVPPSSFQILQIFLFSLHHTVVVGDDAVVVAVPCPLHSVDSYSDECRTVSLLPSEVHSGTEWDWTGTLPGTPGDHTGHGGRWEADEEEISFYPDRILAREEEHS